MSQMMSQDTRFATLLNPIRDLAMNWDVNISSTLEEYLEELDSIHIPKESLGSMNFAEAALLVQGSAVVYCKKVEHLHKLVHQALELVYGQATEKAGTLGDASVAPEDDALLWGEDEKYLLLDDVISEAENIDIPPIDDIKLAAKSRMSISSATSHHSALLMTSLLNSTFTNGKNKLRLSTGSIDSSGALILGKPMPKAREDTFDDGWSDDDNDQPPAAEFEHDDMQNDLPTFEHIPPPTPTAPAAPCAPIYRPVVARTLTKSNPLALLNAHDIVPTSRPVKKGKPFTLRKAATTKSIFKVNAAFAVLYSKTKKLKPVIENIEAEEQWVNISEAEEKIPEPIFSGLDDADDMYDEPPDEADDVQHLIDDALQISTSDTFESLCRQHLQSFLRGAEEYAKETNLSRRVSDWTSRLEPILAEQEARPEFDMHNYSDKALQRLSVSGVTGKSGEQEVLFSDIVGGESRFEVCRLFLACLQLGNLGNIAFNEESVGAVVNEQLKVKVISGVSNRLNIENYRAPSVAL